MAEMRPLSLTDEQLASVMAAANHIRPCDRPAFMQSIADQLTGIEPGSGEFHRALRTALASVDRWTSL